MRRVPVLALLVAALAAVLAPLPASAQPAPPAKAPKIVASTTWVAAFARAAGATDITVVAPANLPHPPDYDPRPSDLAAVADAAFVLMAPFDGFARRLREAAGSTARVVTVDLVNAPETIRAEVTRLGALFGTEAAAAAFLARFDAEHARLSAEIADRLGRQRPRTVAQRFMAPWARLASLELVGTYGPGPLQPAQLAELAAKSPGLVLKNGHSEREGAPSAGRAIAQATGAREVALLNFPADQDLLGLFRENARRIVAAAGATN
ncbi:hypothetical protein PQJ75_21910 [Rhodoplanes sp. TEM]|uniref:ABC transporter substrate-binding protein n=1 Tax=Rhodoplanes tepidamans TaxID=200616 RepID=A0ABT5JHC7_RHOTP|nr:MULTISPECIES: zinc ABC transporter substrate-binding protein [Rhodoplanes]MDC7789002.1 hypothetical protein [Rhodoplanes tepidamans]MDC7986394.1 hypothetical protein [Rhodoplanes sp. TEM]MDQ0355715.1 zinc transport system substrate-binding protein [Rhodoplanes tepidamans]